MNDDIIEKAREALKRAEIAGRRAVDAKNRAERRWERAVEALKTQGVEIDYEWYDTLA